MKTHFSLRSLTMLVWGIFALVLTTQSDRFPLVQLMAQTIASTELGDTIGHAGLFAVLTGILYFGLAQWLRRPNALAAAMLVTLVAGTGTEFYQSVVQGRHTTPTDLMANWLGVLVVGFVIAFNWSLRQSTYSTSTE